MFSSLLAFIRVSISFTIARILVCCARNLSSCSGYSLSFCFESHSVISFICLKAGVLAMRWLLKFFTVFTELQVFILVRNNNIRNHTFQLRRATIDTVKLLQRQLQAAQV